MIKFVILAVCGLMCLTQATPAKLSKEFGTAQEIERQQALKELQNFDFVGAFVKLVLKSPEQAAANVNELLTKNNNALAEEVLDAFNAGLNARIFVINGDYIEIDRAAFGRMIFENTRGFAQVFYPSLQQRSAHSVYERKVQEYVDVIEVKQPLEQFNAILTTERQIGVKAVTLSSILNSIISSISSVVSNILSTVASLIVNLLTAIVSLINNVLAWLQTRISLLFTLLNPIGKLINNILQQIINLLSNLITTATSRKRRDVSEVIDFKATGIVSTVGTLLNNIAEALVSIIKELGGDIISVVKTVVNSLFSTITSVGTALNTLLNFGNSTS
ncbi:unnamed protein product [Ceutorhynchus assimilis]|uniref:Uncharacterized protein n=1 Tax=Ceutorhynchus assimilis TaxID=467358 RepID=A0A9N9QQV0_9CUCU|nr:unnamed protein product [Ceutorhynchus assimilis]